MTVNGPACTGACSETLFPFSNWKFEEEGERLKDPHQSISGRQNRSEISAVPRHEETARLCMFDTIDVGTTT